MKTLLFAVIIFVAVALMTTFCALAGGVQWGTHECGEVAFTGFGVGVLIAGFVFVMMYDPY